mgnify:CR=1 FL=1
MAKVKLPETFIKKHMSTITNTFSNKITMILNRTKNRDGRSAVTESNRLNILMSSIM